MSIMQSRTADILSMLKEAGKDGISSLGIPTSIIARLRKKGYLILWYRGDRKVDGRYVLVGKIEGHSLQRKDIKQGFAYEVVDADDATREWTRVEETADEKGSKWFGVISCALWLIILGAIVLYFIRGPLW